MVTNEGRDTSIRAVRGARIMQCSPICIPFLRRYLM